MEGTERLFDLGELLISIGAANELATDEIRRSLNRHQRGDWGDVDDKDSEANDNAVKTGERLLSAYYDKAGTKYYIITECGWSQTTVLLAVEY